MDMMEVIKTRKSIRTFDGAKISQETLETFCSYIKSIKNPYDIPVEFMLLDSKKYQLSSPVIEGEHIYIAPKCRKLCTVKRHLVIPSKKWFCMHGLWVLELRGLEEH